MLRVFKNIFVFLIIACVLVAAYLIFFNLKIEKKNKDYTYYYQLAIDNYANDVKIFAKKYNIPASYLMALIMLETSGRKPAPVRFEKGVFEQLLNLQKKSITNFEDLKPSDLKNLTKHKIKELSYSYGPFQIMGYKTIKLGINIDDLHNKNAIRNGVYWIDKDYGFLLKQGRFADAFHFHNTGKIVPEDGKYLTHDPNYVSRGLEYMKYFSKIL
jgi:hypothetical protein